MAKLNLGRVGIVPQGDFDNTKTYSKMDMVYYSTTGSSYVSLADNNTALPTDSTKWQSAADVSNEVAAANAAAARANTAAEAAEAVSDEVAELKSQIDDLNDLEYEYENIYVDDLTVGRIGTDGSINTDAAYMAYSPTMRSTGETWYFDTTNFRLMINYYVNSTDTTPASQSNWITTSPYTVPTGRAYYKLQVSRPSSSGTLDIAAAEASVHQKLPLDSALIDIGLLAKSRLETVYVSSASGNDTNSGDATHPFATIQAAINAGACNIIVEEGTYSAIRIDGKNYPIRISLRDYTGSNGKIKITTGGTGTTYGVTIQNSKFVSLSDVWVDNVTRHCFCANDTPHVEFIRCIASNNTTASYMGFYINNANAFFFDCVAHDIAQDGFNFHGFGDSLMQNCIAYDCSDDGVSHHDKCTGSIVGGEFYRCGKGGVSSPVYGAEINIYNVYSHDNNYGLFAEGLSDRTADIKARVAGCAFLNNTTADIRALYGEVIAWNNIYNTLYPNSNAYTELHAN